MFTTPIHILIVQFAVKKAISIEIKHNLTITNVIRYGSFVAETWIERINIISFVIVAKMLHFILNGIKKQFRLFSFMSFSFKQKILFYIAEVIPTNYRLFVAACFFNICNALSRFASPLARRGRIAV